MRLWLALVLAGPLVLPQPPPSTRPPDASGGPAEVFPAAVSVVQVDVVVTDSSGRPVTDLGLTDFEVRQGGRRREVTHASFVPVGPATAPGAPARPAELRTARDAARDPEPARRTLAVVVDDLGLSFESMARVRSALAELVESPVQPGDLVAITRTGGSTGALSRFTSDMRVLRAAVDRIRWNPMGRSGIDSIPVAGRSVSHADPVRAKWLLLGSLEAIRQVVLGMKGLPGRKSLVVLSDSMGIGYHESVDTQVLESLRALAEDASRAWVVIDAIDPRGAETLQFTAADILDAVGPRELTALQVRRLRDFRQSQEGLHLLADETGGSVLENDNDIARGVRRALEGQAGYYLVGFRLDEGADGSAGRPKNGSVKVKVKRPGLRVRSRPRRLGPPGPEARPAPATRKDQLAAALQSPFDAGDIRTRLTALFWSGPGVAGRAEDERATPTAERDPFIRTLLHIDARDLTFVEEEDAGGGGASMTAVVDVLLVVAAGEGGRTVEATDETFTIRAKGARYEEMLERGLVKTLSHPVKAAGACQVRAVVRDAASGRLGSATQFVEVPDLARRHLVLSGVMLQADGPEPGRSATPRGTPAQRTFAPGEWLTYWFVVMNARVDPSSGKPRLEVRAAVLRDGKPLIQVPPPALDRRGQADPGRIVANGRLRLGADLPPGFYVLEVTVTDVLARGRHRTATQAIDFEAAR